MRNVLRGMGNMGLKSLVELQRQIITSLFSDDELLEHLVLKGGNAVDLVHGAAQRASLDLDFSLSTDFPYDLKTMELRFREVLERGLGEVGYAVIDVKLAQRPESIADDLKDFWGGYELEFKLVVESDFEQLKDNQRSLRMAAQDIGPNHRKRFRVDFSKHEFCEGKESKDIQGFRIWVYTPTMIVCEKLRAICQQMPEYKQTVRSQKARPRARDFFDIFALIEGRSVDLDPVQTKDLLQGMFNAKRVSLSLLGRIDEHREFHRSDFDAVKATVKPGIDVKSFDFYVDFVVTQVARLEALWKE